MAFNGLPGNLPGNLIQVIQSIIAGNTFTSWQISGDNEGAELNIKLIAGCDSVKEQNVIEPSRFCTNKVCFVIIILV